MEAKKTISIYLHEKKKMEENTPFQDGLREASAEMRMLSRLLLRRSAAAFLGLPEQDCESWTVREGEHGKPYFPEHPEVCFSISHSGSFWCCAFFYAQVGLDIQRRILGKTVPAPGKMTVADGERENRERLRMQRISDRFFHPSEREYLRRGGDFFEVWTAKESYVKYTGEGMKRSFESFAVADENGLLPFVKGDGPRAVLTHRQVSPLYSLCLCAGQTGEAEFYHI